MVVVEVRQRTLWIAGRSWTRRTTRRRRGDEERRGEEEQATDIKSNNPHLAGGELPRLYGITVWDLRPLLLAVGDILWAYYQHVPIF